MSYMSRFIGADSLPKNLSDYDVGIYFALPKETVEAIKVRSALDRHPGSENRTLALAAQVAFLRATGRSMDNVALMPRALLQMLGRTFGLSVPSIASLKSIYRRRPTAIAHQQWAREHLELAVYDDRSELELEQILRSMAGGAIGVDDLISAAVQWLYDRKTVIPGDRRVRDLARKVFADLEEKAYETVRKNVPAAQRKKALTVLFQKHEDHPTVLQWLRTPPRRNSPSTLETSYEKVAFLKGLKVHDWKLEGISPVRQKVYSQALVNRAPSASRLISDRLQTVEAVCFLKVTLEEMTDSAMFQTDRRASKLERDASDETQAKQAARSGDFRLCLVSILDVARNEALTAETRIASIVDLAESVGNLEPVNKAGLIREALVREPSRVRNLLKVTECIDFQGRKKEPVLRHLKMLRRYYQQDVSELPIGVKVRCGKVWEDLIQGEDRRLAFKALEAATVQGLRRGLRRGSVWVDHSRTFREREQMLIPRDEWQRDRSRHLATLGLPADPEAFLGPFLKLIEVHLGAVLQAYKDGVFTIDEAGDVHLTKDDPLPEEVQTDRLRDQIFDRIGSVQLPDLIVEVDSLTHFSEVLLGRRARDEHELVALYAALFAHGTDVDPKRIAAMIPQLDPGHVSGAMRALESPGRLTAAIDRVVQFQRSHPITQLWGKGDLASSDMMSLEASANLVSARIDPRRRTYSIGLYTHVLDSHGVFYQQPVVLNKRQHGPAIAGVVHFNDQQPGDHRLKRLAVDTHGYTFVGMTVSHGLRFDLCPRVRDLSERKLYVPSDMEVPPELEPIIAKTVSLRSVRRQWDEMLRLLASIASGRVQASVILDRFGTAAKGDPLYRAMDQLGKLLRTNFLCDYLSNAAFRGEIRRVLNRGESVHALQRIVYSGKIAHSRGRRGDEMAAISGSHTLLTNLVIAFHTHRMQGVLDAMRKSGEPAEDRYVARIAPAHSSNINFGGLIRFRIERFRELLLRPARWSKTRS